MFLFFIFLFFIFLFFMFFIFYFLCFLFFHVFLFFHIKIKKLKYFLFLCYIYYIYYKRLTTTTDMQPYTYTWLPDYILFRLEREANILEEICTLENAAFRMYLENYGYYKCSPDIVCRVLPNGETDRRLSSLFTVFGRSGEVKRTRYTIKIFAILRKYLLVSWGLPRDQVHDMIGRWVHYRRNNELEKEKTWYAS